MSDNGASAEGSSRGILKGPGEPGAVNSTVWCGESWAVLENTPFRRYKHFAHEGGISTPLIAHWPAGIQAKGGLRTQPGHLVDIMATCLDVAGAEYPSEFHGNPIPPMHGTSLLPAFANKPIERDAIYWEHEGNAAIRVGDWKLVRTRHSGDWELYNLKTDRTELHNAAGEHPAKVREMQSKWKEWAIRTKVEPNPSGKKRGSHENTGNVQE